MAIKDMQTLLEEGHIAGPLDGSELLLIEQGGFSKVLTVEALYQYLSGRCGCSGGGDCTPTSAEIVGGSLSDSGVPDGGMVTATYRIDDDPPLTVTRTLCAVNGLNKTDLIQDFLLPEIMDSRWLHDYGDPDFRGGDGSDGVEPATLHLLLTPDADYDAVQILFGGPVAIHACGYQQGGMPE